MTTILAGQAAEVRAKGEALIRQADKLLCESWNERMWGWRARRSFADDRPGRERRLLMD
jgi:hypothetical protein